MASASEETVGLAGTESNSQRCEAAIRRMLLALQDFGGTIGLLYTPVE